MTKNNNETPAWFPVVILGGCLVSSLALVFVGWGVVALWNYIF